VTGGDPKTQYALSLGYFNQDGIIKKSAFKRYSSRFNITSALSKSLSVNANLSFLYSNQQAPTAWAAETSAASSVPHLL